MNVTFGALDAFAFVVFAVILAAIVFVVVSLGKLPGQLARKWGHPQASAVNVAGWVGVATGGLIWPLALIWAFLVPSPARSSPIEDSHRHDVVAPIAPTKQEQRP